MKNSTILDYYDFDYLVSLYLDTATNKQHEFTVTEIKQAIFRKWQYKDRKGNIQWAKSNHRATLYEALIKYATEKNVDYDSIASSDAVEDLIRDLPLDYPTLTSIMNGFKFALFSWFNAEYDDDRKTAEMYRKNIVTMIRMYRDVDFTWHLIQFTQEYELQRVGYETIRLNGCPYNIGPPAPSECFELSRELAKEVYGDIDWKALFPRSMFNMVMPVD